MKTIVVIASVKFKWWFRPYMATWLFLAWLTDSQPDPVAVDRVLENAMIIELKEAI